MLPLLRLLEHWITDGTNLVQALQEYPPLAEPDRSRQLSRLPGWKSHRLSRPAAVDPKQPFIFDLGEPRLL
jgi:hypothetical protein